LIRIERRADEGNTGRRPLGENWRSEVIRQLFRKGLRYGSEGFKGDFPKGSLFQLKDEPEGSEG
jgi:hypothetical protein